ncbi:hypothetical protein EV646_106200 [Kribbella antiqua]|uniref:Uncharacterized protein n=1 Tax=Kribbella antiqua TaxID=2512217 RepID=A0A4R2INW0_9ACTN|nr:hypothetical protein EV646_106200 [Kribbella antiqua]
MSHPNLSALPTQTADTATAPSRTGGKPGAVAAGSPANEPAAVATPRLRAVGAESVAYTIPATVRDAGTMTSDTLAQRLHSLTRLGVVPSPASPAADAAPTPSTHAMEVLPATAAVSPAEAAPTAGPAPTPDQVAPTPSSPTTPTRPALVVVAEPAEVVSGAGSAEVVSGAVSAGVVAAGPGVPDARAWAGRLVQAVSEVLAGVRPISQLVRFTDEVVFADLNRRVRLLGLTTTATARGAKERSAVRSIRICTPAKQVAEVAAHVRHGERSRAIALRMEIRRNRWVCTALEIG